MEFLPTSVLPLLRQRLEFEPDEKDGDFLMNMHARDTLIESAERRAAVLIALIERDGVLNVILTKRTEKLNSHSGQVAFPGGKIDDDDASPEAAALREAWEEIGLDINEVTILGRLPDYYSGSRFIIAPVIGVVNSGADFAINEDEVEYMFEVPLSFLMNTDNHTLASREFKGHDWKYYEMPYDGHYIWGVTAGMIRVLYNRVFA